jgi:hypothetical protein
MPYGTVKVDNVTFTNNSVDATTTFSGIYASITNNLTLSGTATAATFTGTTANFTNVNAQNISVTTSLSGLAITGGTAGFTTITGTTVTGTTANFATLSGTTVTGTTANFVTVSGTTVTGNTGQFTNLAGAAAGFTAVTGTTITGTTANFVSGVFTTRILGTTVTGTTASFTSGVFTSLSGTTHTITSGVFASGTAALPSISFVSDPNTGIYSPDADQLAVATNGVERVEFGTGEVVFNDGGTNYDFRIEGDTVDYLFFVDASTDRIGIGTPSPKSILTTQGNIVGLSETTHSLQHYQLAASSYTVTSIDSVISGASGSLVFKTGANWTNGDAVEAARIRGDGMFEVKGAGTAGSSPAFSVNGSAPADSFVIDSSGRLGIGTSSPNKLLHIYGGASDTEIRLQSNSGTEQNAYFTLRNSGGKLDIYSVNGDIALNPGNSVAATFKSDGKVGIGTSGPSDLLHIGNSSATTRTVFRIQTGNAYSDPNGISYANALSSIGARLAIDGTASGYVAQMGVGNSANLWLGSWNSGATDGSIQLVTGNNTTSTIRATLNSTGLGIGTTVANSKLSIGNGASTNDGLTITFTGDNSTLARFYANTSTGEVSIGGIAATYFSTFYAAGSEKARIRTDGMFEVKGAGVSGSSPAFSVSGSAPASSAIIDTSGRLLVGTSTARVNYYNSAAIGSNFQVVGSTHAQSSIIIHNQADNAQGAYFHIGKSRGTAYEIVNDNDPLGVITFQGADGSTMREGASIAALVDGTPGASDLPTRLVFSTTPSSSASPTERMRINNGGNVRMFAGAGQGGLALALTDNSASGQDGITLAHSATGIAGSGTVSFKVIANGNVTNTNNSYLGISDAKLKENIVDANSQWDDLKALQVRNYNFKEGQTHTQIGLVAQEAELVSPGLVSESPDRDAEGNDLGTVTKSVNYSVLYMKAVKALQEAMERIETLEQRLIAAGID